MRYNVETLNRYLLKIARSETVLSQKALDALLSMFQRNSTVSLVKTEKNIAQSTWTKTEPRILL